MKTIVFIGMNKSGSSREAARAAEALGYFTVLLTNNERQTLQRHEYPDIHKMQLVDTLDILAMREEIQKLQDLGLTIRQIVSFVDPYVHIASKLCDEFCENHLSTKAIAVMEDKEKTRLFLQGEPYSPTFQLITPDDHLPSSSTFPMIVKSPKSTGSKDALLAKNKATLKKAVHTLRQKYPTEAILLEEYVLGPQYLIEVMVENGKPHLLAIIKQDITKGKRFIITGYRVLADAPAPIKESLESLCAALVQKFELTTGYFHVELRHTKRGWKLIEMNPRISGGAMNRMLEAAFGFNTVREILKLYVGETPDITPRTQHFVYTKYLIVRRKGILQRVTGKMRAHNTPGIYDVYVKPKKGTLLIPPLSMGHRYAYVIARGDSERTAVKLAESAAREIRFWLRKVR
ncbi:MAG: ATP-grasp domain-containing protein [Solibacillus sp.]